MEKNIELANLRQKIFEESRFVQDNQKFGLFSFVGTLAVSPEPYYQEKKSRKNKDGTVDTGPKNFIAGHTRKGKSPDSYFSFPEYKSDKYIPQQQSFRSEKERVKLMKKFHDNLWKPASTVTEKISLYEHMGSETSKKINRRQDDGSVRLDPKNFYTSPAKKGSVTPGITFDRYPEYMSDPYDLKKLKYKQDKARIKVAAHSSPFKSMDHGGKYFGKYIEGCGGGAVRKKSKSLITSHSSSPFKPTSINRGTIGKYPEYIPNPLLPIKRKMPSEQEPWRSTVTSRTTPTPSIVKNFCNLRTEFPSLRNFT
jgi:Domain of unknown function (DUF4586)